MIVGTEFKKAIEEIVNLVQVACGSKCPECGGGNILDNQCRSAQEYLCTDCGTYWTGDES